MVMAGALTGLAVAGLGIGWEMRRRWHQERGLRLDAEALAGQFEQLYLQALQKADGMEKLYRQEVLRCNKLAATNHALRASIRQLIQGPSITAVFGWVFSKN